jgi:biopolymer transport protein ExbB/TolQ
MRSMIGREAVFSVAALLISAILIQTIYATVIRPRAAAILAEPIAPQEQPQSFPPFATAPRATPEGAPASTTAPNAGPEASSATAPNAPPETSSATAPNAIPETGPSAVHEAAPATTSPATPVRNLRSVFVILKDYEQEVALILATWALCLIGYQASEVARNRRLFDKDYVELGEGRVVLPDDARAYGRPIESLPRDEQEMLLPRALMVALNRFGATRSVQDSAEAVRAECENELDRLDAQLSMVRFTAWAIPAVGFVGTVRGIGRALQEAQGALHGDISGVTLGLGVTFNATLTALVACIIVMFFLHQLQQAQDRLVLDARMYIDRRLIRNMRVQ